MTARFEERDRQRLQSAIAWSDRELRKFLVNRFHRMRQIVGHRYGRDNDDTPCEKVPIPLLGMAVSIYSRQLVSSTPQTLVTTPHRNLAPSARDLQLVLNHLLDNELTTVETMQAIVFDALISIGIAKVGLNFSANSEEQTGHLHDPGQVFFDHILPDQFILDMSARRWDQLDYVGDRYLASREAVLENEEYDAKARKKLKERNYDTEGDRPTGDRDYESQRLTHGSQAASDDSEFVPTIELCDVWLPKQNLMVTLCGEDPTLPPLRVVEWDGPETGPYHVLRFRPIPGNLMPAEPVAMWEEMHEIANRLFRKVVNQAESQKNLIGVSGGSEDDAKRICDAADGEAIAITTPGGTNEFSVGGYNPENFALVVQLRQLFSWAAGNLDAVGGLAAQTSTVGQDRLLHANASQQVREFQDATFRFTRKVLKSLAFYLWTDPVSEYDLMRPIDGTGLALPTSWPFDKETGEDKREGDFFEYNFDISPYSMQQRSPQERIEEVLVYVERVLAPLLPMMQQMGQTLNVEALWKYIAEHANLPELKDLILYSEGELIPEKGPHQPQSKMAPHTSRTYERVSRSAGATPEGAAQVMTQAIFGGSDSVQPKQQMAFSQTGI